MLLLNSTLISAQKNRQFSYWDDLTLVDSSKKIVLADTMTIIYSHRKMHAQQKEFLSQEYDTSQQAHVLLAVCKNLKWTFYQMKDLSSAMMYLPKNKNWCFYIEGFGKTFPLAHYRAAGLATQYNLNVVIYDYPSYNEHKNVIANYFLTLKTAKKSSAQLPTFLKLMAQFTTEYKAKNNNTHFSLLVHSMGNIIVKEAVESKLLNGLQQPIVDRLILNNPCVKAKHHENWVDSIPWAQEVFIHHNKKDRQLMGAYLLQKQKMLGKIAKQGNSKKAYYVDFYKLMGSQHNAFLNKPAYPKIPSIAQEYYSNLFTGQIFPFYSLSILQNNKAFKL